MRIVSSLLFLLLSGAACADELADANKLVENRAYAAALPLYTKLANAGNAEAQFHLGEMYWYGEAGRIDLAVAEGWFKKAADAGNKEAQGALVTMHARALRHADIAYWTSNYDGADLNSGKYKCAPPTIPVLAKDNEAILEVNALFGAWQRCYESMIQNLRDGMPAGKRIPTDLSNLMNQLEYDQAVQRVGLAYSNVAAQEGKKAESIIAEYSAWQAATTAYVDKANAANQTKKDRKATKAYKPDVKPDAQTVADAKPTSEAAQSSAAPGAR
ncbi:MAG: sel1 repeat family protein [Pseudomonadota bacterium]|nr:sel1 repeat family protein [Pseudomonadota bacterium]